ncbi:MAG: rod shape-determining protein MreC [Jatrophihabitans sp.]|uniref:rod shape-determining protein MreC n=1 Tax=Jatrophihabitans sp. TaxID=1932789 RepID=UPI00390F0BF9
MRGLTRRQRASAIVLAVIAACFLTLDLGGGSLAGAHNGVRGALGSLYRGTDAVVGPVRRWVQGVPSAGTNRSRIEQLRAENAALRGRIAALQSDKRTAGQLAELQRAADGSGNRLLPARVVALGPGQGFDWTVTVDVGTDDGVRVGQTVTDGGGLVGRVLHADSASSVVLLAADPGSGVGVRDVRSGEIGIASGRGADGFSFAPLSPDATIKTGDRLATGPAGSSSYVSGIDVGTVTSVRTSADGTVRATVRPAASPTAVDLVGVILGSGTGSLAQRGTR